MGRGSGADKQTPAAVTRTRHPLAGRRHGARGGVRIPPVAALKRMRRDQRPLMNDAELAALISALRREPAQSLSARRTRAQLLADCAFGPAARPEALDAAISARLAEGLDTHVAALDQYALDQAAARKGFHGEQLTVLRQEVARRQRELRDRVAGGDWQTTPFQEHGADKDIARLRRDLLLTVAEEFLDRQALASARHAVLDSSVQGFAERWVAARRREDREFVERPLKVAVWTRNDFWAAQNRYGVAKSAVWHMSGYLRAGDAFNVHTALWEAGTHDRCLDAYRWVKATDLAELPADLRATGPALDAQRHAAQQTGPRATLDGVALGERDEERLIRATAAAMGWPLADLVTVMRATSSPHVPATS